MFFIALIPAYIFLRYGKYNERNIQTPEVYFCYFDPRSINTDAGLCKHKGY